MRASIVIAAHNEGDCLYRTVQSCLDTVHGLDVEFIIADDATSDGSVRDTRRRFPFVRLARHRRRRGCSRTKDLGARRARGDVIVFLDGHCKPEPLAIHQLVHDVESTGGRFVITPTVPNLDPILWRNVDTQLGHGYYVGLESLDCGWLELDSMWRHGRYYESPALCGCCMAISRDLYRKLRGFDPHMVDWGVEDLDLAIKAWLVGDGILHNPDAWIGHRFRVTFDTFTVRDLAVPVNQLRTGRKNLSAQVWHEWLERFRARESPEDWKRIWKRFRKGWRSVERERRYLLSHRKRDEYWYAARFGLTWPRLY